MKKYFIVTDTICQGEISGLNDENNNPVTFNSYEDAFEEMFEDAVSMWLNQSDEDLDETETTRDMIDEMDAVGDSGDVEQMKAYLTANPHMNYNNEFILSEDNFIQYRKAIFVGSQN